MSDHVAGLSGLNKDQVAIIAAVKPHCERLLDHTPRFKYFTLHGKKHLDGLFDNLAILRKGGIELTSDELFILALAICVHDLGMVLPLREKDIPEILDNRPRFPDATALENYVRERHHDLLEAFFEKELTFLLSLGVNPAQMAQVREIARCHRRVPLSEQTGMIRDLGALMRVIDELDIGPARAPTDVFLNLSDEMDATSCWHWFKHNIVDPWAEKHNVALLEENGRKKVQFAIIVRPTRPGSITYWLTQTRRPIAKALLDDGAQKIIEDRFSVSIEIATSKERSSVNSLGNVWQQLEEKALSANRKVVLVIDDEVRKLEDLFLPLMDDYHVIYAYDARDALSKLRAGAVHLAIVDMQIGSGGIWTAGETNDFKSTGVKLCSAISAKYPSTQVGILTGTRHPISALADLRLAFFLRKPVDPSELAAQVNDVLH
jgi:ActR/RegA family two-component response regulator